MGLLLRLLCEFFPVAAPLFAVLESPGLSVYACGLWISFVLTGSCYSIAAVEAVFLLRTDWEHSVEEARRRNENN